MRSPSLLALTLLAVLAQCTRARAQTPPAAARSQTPAAPAWFDAQPLLASLRPAARAGAAQSAGVASLEDLTYYELGLDVDPSAAQFTLHEEVSFTNTTGTTLNEVVFRLYANVLPRSHPATQIPPVTFVSGACSAPYACTVVPESPSAIAVRPSAPLAARGRLRVRFELRGALERIDSSRTNILAQGLEGLTSIGASEPTGDYGVLSVGDGIASLANFYAEVAPRRQGQWERSEASTLGDLGSDEMSHVHARIDVPPGTHVAATGVTIHEDDVTLPASRDASARVGRHRTEVVAAMVRDFAVLAGPSLVSATRVVNGVEIRSHFLPAERAPGERVLDVAAHALEQYERRFGQYPYADLDVVEAPLVGGAGGVEFAGLVTIASMFYRPAAPTDGPLAILSGMLGGNTAGLSQMTDSMLEFVTAHEVAHQFWHGVVGSDSRVHPFVDEGLAQWSAMLYLEDRYGAARARQDGDMQVKMNYQLMRLLGQADGSVDRPVDAFGSSLAYAGLVYGKGPYVYRELRSAVGDTVFFDSLRAYVTQYRFRTAGPQAFVDLLAQRVGTRAHSAARVRTIAHRWLSETHGDDDLGRADLSSLLGSMLGSQGASMGPEMQQALQMLSGSGLLGGSGTRGTGAGNGGSREADQLMRELQRALQEAQ
jgi:hypothetical protein